MSRPFRKVKGVSKRADDFAQLHDRRTFVFSFNTADGGSIESDGSVLVEDAGRLAELWKEVQDLAAKE